MSDEPGLEPAAEPVAAPAAAPEADPLTTPLAPPAWAQPPVAAVAAGAAAAPIPPPEATTNAAESMTAALPQTPGDSTESFGAPPEVLAGAGFVAGFLLATALRRLARD